MMYHSRLGAVWVLLAAAAAAALELYDELSPELKTELLYRDARDIGPSRHLHEDDTEATRLNDLRDGLRTSEHSTDKDMPTGDNPMLTQPRWRSEEKKKPPPGSNQRCYFKLCAITKPGS